MCRSMGHTGPGYGAYWARIWGILSFGSGQNVQGSGNTRVVSISGQDNEPNWARVL